MMPKSTCAFDLRSELLAPDLQNEPWSMRLEVLECINKVLQYTIKAGLLMVGTALVLFYALAIWGATPAIKDCLAFEKPLLAVVVGAFITLTMVFGALIVWGVVRELCRPLTGFTETGC